jgi:hypothetical protein
MPIENTVASTLTLLKTNLIPQAFQYVVAVAPVVLVVFLGSIFWKLWKEYVRSKAILEKKYTVLELKLPKDTWKSPKAMEVFLTALHNSSDGSTYNKYWKGETRPWFSLELISVEGIVKFLIWTEDARKQGVMSALYSQFPEIEIKEVPDYAKSVHFDPNEIRIWAAEFKLANKKSAYPIKTYVDYGLDKDPKEEFKVDPMLPLIEFLGSVGPNQQIWMQILVQAHVDKNRRKKGKFFEYEDAWKEEAKEEINTILMRDAKTKVAGVKDEATGFTKLPSISDVERETAEAIERRIMKLPFDVGIRFLYIAKKDIFNTPFGVGGINSNMKHFNYEHLNGFKANGDKWHPSIGDPWTDFRNWRRNKYGKLALMAYKRRSYFHPPFVSKPMVMNTEELATIYHFPGSVSQTPNLDRVPSKKAQAPGNLPI